METVNCAPVQELVRRLPAKKLPIAYHFLVDLCENDTASLSFQQELLLLPLAERRRLIAGQAEQMRNHYTQASSDHQAWQAGDFFDYD